MDAREHLPYETIRVPCTRRVQGMYSMSTYTGDRVSAASAPLQFRRSSLSLEKSDTLDTICTYEIGYPMKAMYRSECAHLLTADKIVIFRDLDEISARSYCFIILLPSLGIFPD